MKTLLPVPDARAPDRDESRRERVGRAWAAVADRGGPLADPRLRRALRAAWAYARGVAPAAGLIGALGELGRAAEEARRRAAGSVWTVGDAMGVAAAAEEERAARLVADALGRALDPAGCLGRPAGARWDRAWLTSDVTDLARGVADAGRFDLLPVLADALQDAGCDDPHVLGHCRGPGPHAPECWVLEAILNPAGRDRRTTTPNTR